uniref:Alkaline ceramidase n=1 Tax=Salvator merianae TaxID=96440 RepID=A0A8D0E3A0_SALMN
MRNIFAYQSAEIDWCEGNFEHSKYIAEFYNTVKFPGRHSSYAGQLLDELSILWTLSLCYAFWFPEHYFPPFTKNRKQFIWMVLFVSICSTLMSFVKPALNAYALNSVALHFFYIVIKEFRKLKNTRVLRLGGVMTMWWALAISCWLVDKFFCSFCQRVNFCYLHSLWHCFMAIALMHCTPFVIYFDVYFTDPSMDPYVAYWPSEKSPLSLPYIKLQNAQKWH